MFISHLTLMGLTLALCQQLAHQSLEDFAWEEVLPIIKIVCKTSNIIGADINELAPIKNFNSYNFLVAKLAYKMLILYF